ncbi:MAG: carbohydrate binding domain-containing protein [Sedimentisphaerales bacterium]|nr:carbohydrate binding domain-containing protein [Sedimentisphaerales bacterium]
MRCIFRTWLALGIWACMTGMASTAGAADADPFVDFVIPHEMAANSPLAFATEPIRNASDRLVVKDGHFYRGSRRERLWGVNLSFAANFPQKQDAAAVAERLAGAGVNAVRCHHMDSARWPRGIWNGQDGKTIEPEALERLDYFINELAARGIYVNLNLHVGREHSQYLGLPASNHNYDKMIGIFVPPLIEAQKQYARQLLDRVNPYRKLRYADDPAIGIVEITNEDSLFMWSADQTLRTLPDYYDKILQAQYNAWLQNQYGTTQRLRSVWAQGAQELGDTILSNGDFGRMDADRNRIDDWNLEQHEGSALAVARVTYQGKAALGIRIIKTNGTSWHLQINQGGLRIETGKFYTLSFEAAADTPRAMTASVGQAHEPWGNLGLSRQAALSPEWRTFRHGFAATAGDDNARVGFALGQEAAGVYLRNVAFRPGGRLGLTADESLDKHNVSLYGDSETPERTRDRMRFLAETEKAYFDGMRNFIQKDLGYAGLVTGTIVFGPLGLFAQRDMDFIDGHAYWQHPRFPNRPWDAGDWLIDQKAMSGYKDSATLFGLAAERLADKPYTVTEYNHPAPLDSQAECVPMIASFAAVQDWDGVWLYSYSHSNDSWGKQYFTSYFDIHANPGKWGFMRAGAAIFRQAAIEPLAGQRRIRMQSGSVDRARLARPSPERAEGANTLSHEYSLATLADLHLRYDQDMFAILAASGQLSRDDVLQNRLAGLLPDAGEAQDGPATGGAAATSISWPAEAGRGVYAARGPGGWVYTGNAGDFATVSGGAVIVRQPALAALTLTALDDKPLAASDTLLITACGRCENQAMEFSADRRTLGRNWGRPPVRIEAVEGTIALPKGKWRCQALAPDGQTKQDVALISDKSTIQHFDLSSRYGTMWYLARRVD